MTETTGRATGSPGRAGSIRLDKVSMAFAGDRPVLDNLSLDIPAGRLTTLLGPSGCGKTTILKIIAGLIAPASGTVTVDGRPVTGPGPDRTFVFQDVALMPWASVLKNVAFGLELRGTARAAREEIARRYIAEMGLAGFENALPHELSGGMRQRVGLARAFAVDAPVLLMDEPFSAVDEQIRRKFQEDLLGLAGIAQKTIVFVTHSIEEAVILSDRIALLTPRPARVSSVITPDLPRGGDTDALRRDKRYLDTVDAIWQTLRQYLD